MDYALYHPCPIATPNHSSFIVVNPASKGISASEGLIPNAIAVDFVEVNCY
ncbi:putative zinc-metalloprotease [Streptococcus mitis]|nr:putative zinc-metalloprotease [Streptococcus mitis]